MEKFHSKFHRTNHWNRPPVSGEYGFGVSPDAAQDPLALSSAPFLGDFFLKGALSSQGIFSNTANICTFNCTDLFLNGQEIFSDFYSSLSVTNLSVGSINLASLEVTNLSVANLILLGGLTLDLSSSVFKNLTADNLVSDLITVDRIYSLSSYSGVLTAGTFVFDSGSVNGDFLSQRNITGTTHSTTITSGTGNFTSLTAGTFEAATASLGTLTLTGSLSTASLSANSTRFEEIVLGGGTASTVAVVGSSKKIESSTVTTNELFYLKGVNSPIQNQIDNIKSNFNNSFGLEQTRFLEVDFTESLTANLLTVPSDSTFIFSECGMYAVSADTVSLSAYWAVGIPTNMELYAVPTPAFPTPLYLKTSFTSNQVLSADSTLQAYVSAGAGTVYNGIIYVKGTLINS